MIGAIVHVGMDAQNGEPAQNTCIHSLSDAFAYRRNIFLRNGTAYYCGFVQQHGRLIDQDIGLGIKLELLTVCLHGLELNLTVSVLSTSAGLLGVLGIHFHRLGECFLVCNLRSAHIGFHLELSQQTVHDDLQMELAHACDDGLARLLIGMSTEGRILLRQLRKRLAHLALTGLGLRLDSQLDNGLREFHGLQNHGMLLIADGVAGGGELEAHCRGDIAGIHLIQLCTLVCMHLQNTAHALLLVLGGIQHIGT